MYNECRYDFTELLSRNEKCNADFKDDRQCDVNAKQVRQQ